MKKYIMIIFILFIMTGCSNKLELTKEEYIALKNEILKYDEFVYYENLPFSINVKLDKVTDDEIRYAVIIENPTKVITDISALAVHDKHTEDIFPSIGIFDALAKLDPDSEEERGIILAGFIPTNQSVEELKPEIKLIMQYTEDGEVKKIFYKATNITE